MTAFGWFNHIILTTSTTAAGYVGYSVHGIFAKPAAYPTVNHSVITFIMDIATPKGNNRKAKN